MLQKGTLSEQEKVRLAALRFIELPLEVLTCETLRQALWDEAEKAPSEAEEDQQAPDGPPADHRRQQGTQP